MSNFDSLLENSREQAILPFTTLKHLSPRVLSFRVYR